MLLAPVNLCERFHLHLATHGLHVVLWPCQFPLEAGRRDFKRVGPFEWVVLIDEPADTPRQFRDAINTDGFLAVNGDAHDSPTTKHLDIVEFYAFCGDVWVDPCPQLFCDATHLAPYTPKRTLLKQKGGPRPTPAEISVRSSDYTSQKVLLVIRVGGPGSLR